MAKKVIATYSGRAVYGSTIQVEFVSTTMIPKVHHLLLTHQACNIQIACCRIWCADWLPSARKIPPIITAVLSAISRPKLTTTNCFSTSLTAIQAALPLALRSKTKVGTLDTVLLRFEIKQTLTRQLRAAAINAAPALSV
eukprot:SAG31_NODE_4934_length_2850_cov_5.152253_2_plen_140_part_00